MADQGDAPNAPILSQQSKQVLIVLANLFFYSVAMFTLPFIAFFGVRHMLTLNYPDNTFLVNVWSVASSVVVVNIIIGAYVYKAYYEKEYDEHGNEIDQHAYPPPAPTAEVSTVKSSLNLKHD
ncbi:unnamed protein product [Spodoptera exigua]|nr:unnamed protein product [Spodoptera exigua]